MALDEGGGALSHIACFIASVASDVPPSLRSNLELD